MTKITSLFVAFGLAASIAAAGDGEGCPACPAAAKAKPTTLATARKALAEAKKADEKLPEDQRKELLAARETMLKSPFGKAMGQSLEACGWAMIAGSAQPGTSAEAVALMKDMGMSFCAEAKIFGGCADCQCCEETGDCCQACKDMTPEAATKKATESLATAKKSLETAMVECNKMSEEQMQKMQAAMDTMQKLCPVYKAMKDVNASLTDGFASLAKMGIPSAAGKTVTDQLIKGAAAMHATLSSDECEEGCEGCEQQEGCEDSEGPEGAEMPHKSS
jgi:hypothetical protein